MPISIIKTTRQYINEYNFICKIKRKLVEKYKRKFLIKL